MITKLARWFFEKADVDADEKIFVVAVTTLLVFLILVNACITIDNATRNDFTGNMKLYSAGIYLNGLVMPPRQSPLTELSSGNLEVCTYTYMQLHEGCYHRIYEKSYNILWIKCKSYFVFSASPMPSRHCYYYPIR